MGDIIPSSLEETIEMMESRDPVERFKAEYYQLAIRIIRLENKLKRKEAILDENLKVLCSVQLSTMHGYLDLLELRAKREQIHIVSLEDVRARFE